jgi:CheY-like chemotaxis protein
MKNSALVVEDDEYKANDLVRFLSELGYKNIIVAENLLQAVDLIDESHFALALIDMAIPSHPKELGGGSPHNLLAGGIQVLMELNDDNRNEQCVVITQYPDIPLSGRVYSLEDAPAAIKKNLNCDVLACIRYDESDIEKPWENEIRRALGIK